MNYNWRTVISRTVNYLIVVTKVVVANRDVSYIGVK
jgi:hypothetical protein